MVNPDLFIEKLLPDGLRALSGREPYRSLPSASDYWLTSSFDPFGAYKAMFLENSQAFHRALRDEPLFFPFPYSSPNLFLKQDMAEEALPDGFKFNLPKTRFPVLSLEVGSDLPINDDFRITPVANPKDYFQAIKIQSLAFDKKVFLPDDHSLADRVLGNPNVTMLSVERDSHHYSTITLVEHAQGVGTVWDVATHPDRQSQGAGTAGMSYGINFFRQRGVQNIFLMSSESGSKLYSNLGFTQVGDVIRTRVLGSPGLQI